MLCGDAVCNYADMLHDRAGVLGIVELPSGSRRPEPFGDGLVIALAVARVEGRQIDAPAELAEPIRLLQDTIGKSVQAMQEQQGSASLRGEVNRILEFTDRVGAAFECARQRLAFVWAVRKRCATLHGRAYRHERQQRERSTHASPHPREFVEKSEGHRHRRLWGRSGIRGREQPRQKSGNERRQHPGWRCAAHEIRATGYRTMNRRTCRRSAFAAEVFRVETDLHAAKDKGVVLAFVLTELATRRKRDPCIRVAQPLFE